MRDIAGVIIVTVFLVFVGWTVHNNEREVSNATSVASNINTLSEINAKLTTSVESLATILINNQNKISSLEERVAKLENN